MKALRADTLTEVDLSGKGLGLAEALELRELLKASSKLIACNLLQNEFDVESAKMLAAIGTEKRIMLSGIKHDQTEACFMPTGMHGVLMPADGILIASDLMVSSVLTTLDIPENQIRHDLGRQACSTEGQS